MTRPAGLASAQSGAPDGGARVRPAAPRRASGRASGERPVATIVYKSLLQYRLPFYEGLRRYLNDRGVGLRLIYGQPEASERTKRDTGELAWAHPVRNRIVSLGGRSVYWQPCLRLLRGSDLIIVEQASKLLLNYVLLARQALGGPRVAFWGHGRNFQGHSASWIGERVKGAASRRVHWWFAYNETSAAIVRSLGYPTDHITSVQNSVDTAALRRAAEACTDAQLDMLRAQLGLRGRNVGVFVGSLYAEKGLDYLLEAAREIRARVPDFELIVVGAGPDQARVVEAARRDAWIHLVGPQFGDAKVPYFKLAKVALLPGAMGLAVLDAFALEVPMVTIELPNHGPEIEYLVHGENGVRMPAGTTPRAFGAEVADLLGDRARLAALVAGCRRAARHYTMENMVARFGDGVLLALEAAVSPASR